MNAVLVATLRSTLSENDSHKVKIQNAVRLLWDRLPFTTETFQLLNDGDIMVVDQLLYRFTKMQDSLGTRFFPALYSLLEEDFRPKPFLDILNRLEQLRVLESVETWQLFRDLRNRFAHDYPETLDQTVQSINTLALNVEQFLSLYETAKKECLLRLGSAP